MQISELIEQIGVNKKRQAEAYKTYKDLKEIEEIWKAELMAELDKSGLKSAKGEKYMASISSRSDVIVTSESDVVEWLKNDPNVEEDAYIGLKVSTFKPLANEVLKKTGEIIPGTERVIKDSLTIKENK